MLPIRDPASQSIPCDGACNSAAGQHRSTDRQFPLTNRAKPASVRHPGHKTPLRINLFRLLQPLFHNRIHNQPIHQILNRGDPAIGVLKDLKAMLYVAEYKEVV